MPTTTGNNTIESIVKIAVDYNNAIKKLGDYKKILKDVKDAQKALKAELDAGTITDKEYATQMAYLHQQQKKTTDQYNRLTKVVQNQIKTEQYAKGSLVALRAQLSNLTAQFDKLSASARNGAMGKKLMKQINDVTKEIKDAESATQRFYRNVGNYQSALKGINEMTKGFKTLGGIITGIMGGLGFNSFITNMMTMAKDFEDGIARVRAVANPLAGELDALREKAKELGRTTRYTASEVASGMEELSRKGLSARETLEAIRPTLQLAQANVVSIADAAQVSASTMRAFGMQAADLAHINDVLSSACAHSATNLIAIGEAMKTAGPTASAANVKLEETVALIGSLANVGMTGSDAGTGVKQVILALDNAIGSKKGVKILEAYNLNIDEARIRSEGLLNILKEMKESGIGESIRGLTQLVGKYAAPRLAQLINQVDSTIKLNKTLQESLGENARMFEQSIGNTSNAIYMLKSTWESFMIDVYDSTDSYVVKPINGITEAIRVLSNNIAGVTQLIASIIATVTFAPLLGKIHAEFTGFFLRSRRDYTAVLTLMQADTTSFLAKLKINTAATMTAIKEVVTATFTAIKAVLASVAPLLAVTAFFEVAQAIWGWYKGLTAVEDKINDINETIREAQNNNEMVKKLEFIKNKLNEIHGKHELTKTDLDQEQKLIAQANGLLGTQYKTYNDINGAIDDQIEKLKKTIRLQGMMSAYSEAYGKVVNIASSYGIDPYDTRYDASTPFYERVNSEFGSRWGERSGLRNYGSFLLGGFKHTMATDRTELGQAVAILRFFESQLDDDQKLKSMGLLDDNNLGGGTQKGEPIDLGKYTEKNAKDLANTFNNLFDKWLKKKIDLDADILRDPIEKMRLDALGEFEKLSVDIDRILNKEGTGWSKTMSESMRKAINSASKEDQAKLLATMNAVRKEAQIKANIELEKIELDHQKRMYELQKVNGEALIKLIASQLSARNNYELKAFGQDLKKGLLTPSNEQQLAWDIENENWKNEYIKSKNGNLTDEDYAYIDDYTRKKDAEHKAQLEAAVKEKNVIAITKDLIRQRIELIRQEEEAEKKKAILEQEIADAELKKALISGEKGFVQGSADEIIAKKNSYTASRDGIESRRASDTSYTTDNYESDVKALNDQYGAEAEALQNFYNQKRYMDLQYQQEEQNRRYEYNNKRIETEKALWEDLKQIALQGIQNKFQEIQNGYLAQTAAAGEHFNDLTYGEEAYWERLRSRIGERDAYDLQSQYEQYQKELELFKQTKEEDYESHEAYTAKKAELDKQGQEIHIKTNDAITKSDEARWQAASQITGGLSQLVEQMGDEESDAAKLAKVIALAQIAISTGEAIAKMVAAEAGKGVLGIATTAAGIAEIMANIATAISTVKSAKFATGAVNIRGAGTSTSDSIPAYISNGESVMNAKATRMFEPLLLAMNAIGNGVILPRNNYVQTRQTADLSESFTQAVANIRPVVDVQEITRTQNRVEVIQNLDSI